MNEIIIHPSYFVDVIALVHIHKSSSLLLETQDSYVKQTYRNRTYIAAANGKLALNIPVIHQKKGNSVPYNSIEIDHSQNWATTHLKSIKSAYYSSPYFEYYQDDLEMLFKDIPTSLIEWNIKTLHFLLEHLQLHREIKITQDYQNDPLAKRLIHAKDRPLMHISPYIQVFQEKHGFTQPLSGLDVLFNLGPATGAYLKNQYPQL
ncbi:hypothetical protein CW736_10495 [Nonlabens sp. MB-3u-79]|uniref:WbqC family protein n=1 Tax=Nonlabens sp. MB-3u-79 TaxID=2058134 RepID=UPI000C3157F9|nr:WbqC family protein [Nonlabens sp. MB-3u-79]AUC79761.1 hypothetical protein CW736_10495 [Nonlabens sp. MB-3u-79]